MECDSKGGIASASLVREAVAASLEISAAFADLEKGLGSSSAPRHSDVPWDQLVFRCRGRVVDLIEAVEAWYRLSEPGADFPVDWRGDHLLLGLLLPKTTRSALATAAADSGARIRNWLGGPAPRGSAGPNPFLLDLDSERVDNRRTRGIRLSETVGTNCAPTYIFGVDRDGVEIRAGRLLCCAETLLDEEDLHRSGLRAEVCPSPGCSRLTPPWMVTDLDGMMSSGQQTADQPSGGWAAGGAEPRSFAPSPSWRCISSTPVPLPADMTLTQGVDAIRLALAEVGAKVHGLEVSHWAALEEVSERRVAANTIQRVWRAYLARRAIAIARCRAVIVQATWRAFVRRRSHARRVRACIRIQRAFRRSQERRGLAARRIVRWWQHQRMRRAATKLQALSRSWLSRAPQRAAPVIQRCVRRALRAMALAERRRRRRHRAACAIERAWRRYVWGRLRWRACLAVQRAFRAHRHRLASRLQSVARRWLAGRRVARLRIFRAALNIQRTWRGFLDRRRASRLSILYRGARGLQRLWRGFIMRKRIVAAGGTLDLICIRRAWIMHRMRYQNGGERARLADASGNDAAALAALGGSVCLLRSVLAERLSKTAWFRNAAGQTPLHLATASYRYVAATVLIDEGGAPLDATDNDGRTPLHIAVQTQRPALIELFLRHGAPLDVVDSGGAAALHLAVALGRRDIVTTLLDAGAIIDHPGGLEVYEFPIHVAARRLDLRMLRLLVARKANVNVGDHTANTSLHVVCAAGAVDLVQFLVDEGADVNANNAAGDTPPHICSANGFLDCLVALFRHRGVVEMTRRNVEGLTPVEAARSKGHEEIVRFIQRMLQRTLPKLQRDRHLAVHVADYDGPPGGAEDPRV